MNNQSKFTPNTKKMGSQEILALVWITLAIVLLFPVTSYLNGTFPIFTLILLVVPLFALLRNRDSRKIGFQTIRWCEFLKYTSLNLAGSLALGAIFEPWSHTYRLLLIEAISSAHLDTTFGWLVRFPGFNGWGGFVLYAGFVTLFAEEIFFRGWLLKWLKSRMSNWRAILLQAALFTLLQLLAAFFLPPLQGILYVIVYSWLAIGLISGWIASRTESIFPSLASALFFNSIMAFLSI
jgi:membrane protease YdiL (CAAX protease family)